MLPPTYEDRFAICTEGGVLEVEALSLAQQCASLLLRPAAGHAERRRHDRRDRIRYNRTSPMRYFIAACVEPLKWPYAYLHKGRNPCPIFAYMDVESCDEAKPHTERNVVMRRTGLVQNEQYTTLRSRLHHKSLPKCRSCHAPIHKSEVVCPWCGANRKTPVTGTTQPLPKLPAPAPWYREYDRLLPGVLLTFFQVRLWLWLWPLPAYADRRIMLFYYAMVLSLAAALFYHCRWTFRLVVALAGLLFCWALRAAMG
jgi:hypothetical protein